MKFKNGWFAVFAVLLFSVGATASPRSPRVIYEVFTRSFQDSNGDGVGDLDGITSRLDYLNNGTTKSLGVDALWLTPLFPSPSYHGYDATNYVDVNPLYGNLNSMARLITEAHHHGIRVFLDMAVNHTSNRHPWFESSASSPSSPDRGLYLWSPSPLDWPFGIGKWHALNGEFYYGSFGGEAGVMPDLNWKNPMVLHKIEEVFLFWTKMGIDGFRLDAAKFLDKGPQGQQNTALTHQIWKQIIGTVRQVNPQSYFVGEVWDSAANIASYYGGGDELDSAFDFPVAFGMRTSHEKEEDTSFAGALEERVRVQPNSTFTSPIINNHDMVRIASLVRGDMAALKLAAVAQLTLPGTPTIYYGDEIGIPEGPQVGDLGKRTPMSWDNSANHGFTSPGAHVWAQFSTDNPAISAATQAADPGSLLNSYRNLLQLKRQMPALRSGQISQIHVLNAGVVTYVADFSNNAQERNQVLMVLNFSKNAFASLSVPVELNGPVKGIRTAYGTLKGSVAGQKGRAILLDLKNLPPSSGHVVYLNE